MVESLDLYFLRNNAVIIGKARRKIAITIVRTASPVC